MLAIEKYTIAHTKNLFVVYNYFPELLAACKSDFSPNIQTGMMEQQQ